MSSLLVVLPWYLCKRLSWWQKAGTWLFFYRERLVSMFERIWIVQCSNTLGSDGDLDLFTQHNCWFDGVNKKSKKKKKAKNCGCQNFCELKCCTMKKYVSVDFIVKLYKYAVDHKWDTMNNNNVLLGSWSYFLMDNNHEILIFLSPVYYSLMIAKFHVIGFNQK